MPDDPLYLSNRGWRQRLKLAAIVGVPLLLIVAAITYASLTAPAPVAAPTELSPAEVAARSLPGVPKDLKLGANVPLEVQEITIHQNERPRYVSGLVKNPSERRYQSAEFVFELTDMDGSQVGAVNTTIHNVQPYSTTRFQIPIEQENAAFALVRVVRAF